MFFFKKKKNNINDNKEINNKNEESDVKVINNNLESIIKDFKNEDNTSRSLDVFLENFFTSNSFYILEVMKPPKENLCYVELIGEEISAIIFTTRKNAEEYIKSELLPDGIVVKKYKSLDFFNYLDRLKVANCERILFNYPKDWISFSIK